MKKIIFGIILIISLIFIVGIFVMKNKNTESNNSNYNAEKSSITKKDVTEIIPEVQEKKETEIASFSTKIRNKDKERQNNISITTKKIHGKEVKTGEIFSFCETVGKATAEEGYQKADIYVDGKKEQGYGGGNCQVSTTLYNAVLQVNGLEVIERHEHSGHVPYVEKGKDAAVSYGSYDFKFKNNTDNIIKINIENNENEIIAKLIKVE